MSLPPPTRNKAARQAGTFGGLSTPHPIARGVKISDVSLARVQLLFQLVFGVVVVPALWPPLSETTQSSPVHSPVFGTLSHFFALIFCEFKSQLKQLDGRSAECHSRG